MRRLLHTRLVPLLSLFAAFSFVVMMFNIPLPGGTTGHAVGVGLSTVVLGPWASVLAISVALVIQAFFFGDGGITAIGANCFNMAIAGSFVAWAVYRVLAGGAALDSTRRTVAAGLAGYAAINVAALLTAIEFGIQPLLFVDASGAPLYAPIRSRIAVPAMMAGHVTVAGMAEADRHRRGRRLPATHRPLAARHGSRSPAGTRGPLLAVRRRTLRALWAGLGILMVLAPLGLLAAGTAWGEWARDRLRRPGRTRRRSRPPRAARLRRPGAGGPRTPVVVLDGAVARLCPAIRAQRGLRLHPLRAVRRRAWSSSPRSAWAARPGRAGAGRIDT